MENSEMEAEQIKIKNTISQSVQTNQNLVNVIEKRKSMKDVSKEKSGNYLNKQTSFKDNYIINFIVEDNIQWGNFLVYLAGLCTEANKDDIWKIRNIQRLLTGKALTA